MKRIEVLNRIREIYNRLENESLEPQEIEELVDLSSNLHERALILRYKVAEQKIFGENNDLNTVQIADKAEEVATELPKEIASTPTLDFSIFEEKIEVVEEELAAPEKEESIFELIMEEPATLFQSTETIQENEPETKEPLEEEVIPVQEEEVMHEEEPTPVIPVATNTNQDNWSVYFEQVLNMHGSGLQTTLHALSGSFGLNERILYINELFNGEAENFSNAIIEMDKIMDWATCKTSLNRLANEQGWEKESETVGEFVLHVRRKYA
jgi:hypothetical protein